VLLEVRSSEVFGHGRFGYPSDVWRRKDLSSWSDEKRPGRILRVECRI